jgi:hypothetical protein
MCRAALNAVVLKAHSHSALCISCMWNIMRKYIDSRCLSAAMMRKFTDITLTYKCFRRVHPLKYIICLRKWRKHRLQEMRGIGRHVDRGYQCGRLADIRL